MSTKCIGSGWLVDNGATDHICSDLAMFSTYNKVTSSNEFIIVPDGRKIPILHTGIILLDNEFVLQNVLHVPDFQFHLISVQKLCQDLNFEVMFTSTACILQGPFLKGQQIHLGRNQGGLYRVDSNISHDIFKTICFSQKKDIILWHLRLGHIHFHKISLIPSLGNLTDSSTTVICQICLMSRQTRHSFPHSTIKLRLLLKWFTLMFWDLIR